MNAIDTAALHTAARANINAEIVKTYAAMSNALQIKDARRREALLAQYEEYMDDLDAQMAALDDLDAAATEIGDEEAEAEVVAPKRAVTRAMASAKKSGVALIKGAAGVGRKLEKMAPGCLVRVGHTQIWDVQDEETGEAWRLTLTDGATTGAMRHYKTRM